MAKNMKKMSKLFNASKYATFTPEEKLVVEVNTEFAEKSQYFLHSNTYHENLVKLPGYNEVPYWQGPGTSFDFADCSKINIKNEAIDENNAIEQGGIVAFVRDEENVKAYYGDRETWELPNPRNRTVIHGEQAEKGYAVDPHANAWVFYIANS